MAPVFVQSAALGLIGMRFEFGEQELVYSFSSPTGTTSYNIEYEVIPREFKRFTGPAGAARRRVVLYGLGAAVALACTIPAPGLSHAARVFLAVGIAAALLVMGFADRWTKVTLTKFSTPRGPIEVLADGHHDEILREIAARRKAQVLWRHGQVNFFNDPNKEIAKFQFMRKNDYITEQEMNDAILKIVSARRSGEPPPAPPQPPLH
jgi:hypothetical protein